MQLRRWRRGDRLAWASALALRLAGTAAAQHPGIAPAGFLQDPSGPVLVRGAYGLPQGMDAAGLRGLGFNVLHAGADEGEWTRARGAGLRVWHALGAAFDHRPELAGERELELRRAVERWGSRPELLFWESIDEPAWTDGRPEEPRFLPEPMTRAYAALRATGDRHPVYLNHAPRNTVETLRRYSASCDIVCADIYPVIPRGLRPMYAITPDGRHGDHPDQTIACVGRYVAKMREVARPGQAVFVVLQGFAWEALRPTAEQDPAQVQYPSYAESRFMAWDALAHGATGIMYWGLHTVPGEHPFVRDLGRVLREIEELEPILVGGRPLSQLPALRYEERGATVWDGLRLLGLAHGGAVWLVAINPSIDPATVTFSGLPPELAGAAEMEAWGEARPRLPVAAGSFRDEFGPYAVHLYRAVRREGAS